MGRFSVRLGGATALALALLAVPLTMASAAPPDTNWHACPATLYGQAISFTMPLPDSIRSVGTHSYEFSSTWDGGSGASTNSVTFDSSAPIYPGDAFVRPFYLLVQLADGSVSDQVTTLNPSQRARFGITWYMNFRDTSFANSILVSVRWETSPGVWSSWVQLPKGPVTAPCAPGGTAHYGGYFKEAWGWGG